MSLAKKAKGLQRFMLDCGFWQSPSWKGLRKVAVIGLQAAAISYCNEHLTDGRLPGPADELASALGLQEPDIAEALQHLLDRKRWIEDGDEYVIVGYEDHNPLRHEVEDDRARRAQAAAKANHERWHVEKGVVDPTCDLCPSHNGSQTGSEVRSDSDRAPDVDHIPSEGSMQLKDAKEASTTPCAPAERPSAAIEVIRGPLVPQAEPIDKVTQVFLAWCESTKRDPNRTRLDPKRRKAITDALKAYPLGDVIDAVKGWKHSAHHRGENDRQTVYNDVRLLLRDASQIENFRDLQRRYGDQPARHLPARMARLGAMLGGAGA